ncbi:MAG: hypothetical protein K6E19_01840 [Lachnospiraceae bacterium]|nr:hypothetical protein [Lachnospiraceae bacterium]
MDRKKIPAILMLSASAITSLIVYFRGYGLKVMVIALAAVLIAFYIIGSVIRMVLDSYYKANEEQVSDEGEVIEKTEGAEETPESQDFGTEEVTGSPEDGQ